MSEFAQFLPPSTGVSPEEGEFGAFRPPVKKKEPPGITDRIGTAAVDLWDAARKAPVSPPVPTSPTGFDISPPPGMSPDQQLFEMGQVEVAQKNGKPVNNLLQEMAGRGWKINTPVKAAAPAPPSSTAPSLLTKIPYSGIEGAPTGEESSAPLREVAAAAGRSPVGQPFVKQYDTVRGSFLKGGGALTKGRRHGKDIGDAVVRHA